MLGGQRRRHRAFEVSRLRGCAVHGLLCVCSYIHESPGMHGLVIHMYNSQRQSRKTVLIGRAALHLRSDDNSPKHCRSFSVHTGTTLPIYHLDSFTALTAVAVVVCPFP